MPWGAFTDRIAVRRAADGPSVTGSSPDAGTAREASRAPWSAPRGRELLGGIAVLAVLVAILVVFRNDVPPAPRGGPEPFALRAAVPAPTAPTPWSEVPILQSVSELPHELARPVAEGLAQARSRLDRCVALEHRRAGQRASGPFRPAAPAQVVLRLAARAGAVQVDGLEVTAPGDAPEVLNCARRLLDGDTLAAGAGVPGWRQRLAVSLQ